MLNLDPAKLLVIAVVAIILLGPDRLPQVARQVGGVWRSFTDYRHRMESQVRSAIPDLPSSAEIARLARSPSALLNHLSSMSPEAADEADISSDAKGENAPPGTDVPSPSVVEPAQPPGDTRTPVPRPESADPGLN
jgi:sec-independent protein translocase protein TatB